MNGHRGNIQPGLDLEEHRSVNGVNVKAVANYVFDGTTLAPQSAGLLDNVSYDYIEASYPTSSSEVYAYKLGGSGGTTQATLTVTYTDSTKANLSSVARS